MQLSLPPSRTWLAHKAKVAVATTGLVALGVAFEILSRHSAEMRREIEPWSEGRTFALGVLPAGPSIAVRKQHGRLEYLGRGDHGAPLRILFKNVDSALGVLTGLMSAHQAFAEHRILVHGPIDETVQANRAMAIVVKFLFPSVMLGSLTKRKPVFTRQELLLKARLYATLGPALVRSIAKVEE
jgi:hypothetical protein